MTNSTDQAAHELACDIAVVLLQDANWTAEARLPAFDCLPTVYPLTGHSDAWDWNSMASYAAESSANEDVSRADMALNLANTLEAFNLYAGQPIGILADGQVDVLPSSLTTPATSRWAELSPEDQERFTQAINSCASGLTVHLTVERPVAS